MAAADEDAVRHLDTAEMTDPARGRGRVTGQTGAVTHGVAVAAGVAHDTAGPGLLVAPGPPVIAPSRIKCLYDEWTANYSHRISTWWI